VSPAYPALSALVLAGGAARRMGGSKAGERVGGRTLLERSLALAADVADETLLLGGLRALDFDAPSQDLRGRGLHGPRVHAVRHVPDWPAPEDSPDSAPEERGPQGPLAALGAGLQAARHDWCLLLACDMPFVTPRAIEALRAAAAAPGARAGAAPFDAVLFAAPGGFQPFPGLFHRRALPRVRACLQAGERSLQSLIAALDVRLLDGAPDARVLHNVNTPSDLRAARDIAAGEAS
jgi:molybdopterin-guanine dinucleotide biosynthesis protein A